MLRQLRHWLHRRQRPLRYAHLQTMLCTQSLTRGEVLRKQHEDFERIVAFAAANTDYYQHTLAPVLAQGDWQIADLPLLRKSDVTAHLDGLLVRNAERSAAKMGYTGGSTGKPLAFWYDEAKHELMRAGMMRSYMMAGWRTGDKILNFWGARQDTVSGGVFGAGYGDFIAAEMTIPAYEYTEAQLAAWAKRIRRYRPVLLQGYASILAELARFVLTEQIAMPGSLIGVYSTAEVLDEAQRHAMEQAFGCKVFNQYGSREIPNIACECRQGNMHVFSDMVYLESLPLEGENRLIVTSLTNRLMPFIRYDIGDSGQLKEGECPCGSPFPLMEMGMCRQNDLIRAPGGKKIHPSFFNRLLYGLTQIEQYQFVREEPGQVMLKLVSPVPLDAAAVARLQDSVRQEADAALELQVEYVAEIPRTASGKHRFVISRCA